MYFISSNSSMCVTSTGYKHIVNLQIKHALRHIIRDHHNHDFGFHRTLKKRFYRLRKP